MQQRSTVSRSDGTQASGELEQWNTETITVRGATETARIDVASIRQVQIQGERSNRTAKDPGPQIVLVNGDEIAARDITIVNEAITFSADAFGTAAVPLEFLKAVHFSASADSGRTPIAAASEGLSDVAQLKNGDSIRGTLLKMDHATLVMETPLGAVSFPREKLRSLFMNPDLFAAMAKRDRYWLMDLADGSWLTCPEAAFEEDGMVRVKYLGNVELRMRLDQLAAATFYGGDVVSVADRVPVTVTGRTFFGQQIALAVNRNVRGGPLIVGQTRFLRGLGMASRTACTFAIRPGDQSFSSRVGIDDVTGTRGSVIFRVLVDGKEAWTSGLVTGRSDLVTVGPISLNGANEFTLVVDYGDGADVQDVADWCDPVILRSDAK